MFSSGSTSISNSQKIALIESTKPTPLHPLPLLPDIRVSSINLASIELFKGKFNQILSHMLSNRRMGQDEECQSCSVL